MTLEEFAKDAGCVVSTFDEPNWGGKWQYHHKDSPNCRWRGFRTESAAYKGFLEGTFGEQATKAIIKLLKKTEKCK